MKVTKYNLKESITDTLSGPPMGPEAGLSSMLIEAINGEWETIDKYNSMAITARNEGFEDIAKVLEEINTEENKHVGQLQELLKSISPNAEAISDGEEEAEDYIDDDVSWYKD
jgi:rubrerythrin